MSSPVMTLLSALLLSVDPGGGAVQQGCDNGKLWLERDLPLSAVWSCPGPACSESTQRLPGIDTHNHPQSPKEVCMNASILYNHSIPSSGAYRPVGGESGEYLYCPPQRWLNNLQHGATVLLFHPCAPASERDRLSVLARSCLSSYIITPHPDLSTQRMFALVSWGRTLELSSLTASEVCDWLKETTTMASFYHGDVVRGRKYSLLLTHPAEPRQNQNPRWPGRTLSQCCQESLAGRPGEWMDGRTVWRRRGEKRREGSRIRRAAIEERVREGKVEKEVEKGNHSADLFPFPSSSWVNRTVQGSAEPSETKKQGLTPGLNPRSPGLSRIDSDPWNTSTLGEIDTDGQHPSEKKSLADRVEVQEREADPENSTHSKARHNKKKKMGSEPHHRKQGRVTQSRRDHQTSRPLGGAVLNDWRPTARTNEAVWAAASLGFLLVLLALAVLHTRLYRHWRTTPSLYWHNTQQDYDSVGDIIRRRLRMADRRRKRRASLSRRQECSLIPGSSTEEEDL